MAKRTKRRTGRPKAGEERLTPERIFAAALALIDAEGVEALSMRRLAQALEVDPMAIYRHVPDKEGVIRGVVGLVFEGFTVDPVQDDPGQDGPGELSWQDQVRVFAEAFYAMAQAHPHVVIYLVTHAEVHSPAVLAANERLYAALARAPLRAAQLVDAADLVVDYLHGYILPAQTGWLGSGEERREMLDLLAEMPPGTYPTLQRVMGEVDQAAIVPDFQRGLDLILAGIAAQFADN